MLIYPQFRYNEICVVFRLWSHLKLLKRGGAGHQCDGVDSMKDGSLAILCPACPQPGKNTVTRRNRPMYVWNIRLCSCLCTYPNIIRFQGISTLYSWE